MVGVGLTVGDSGRISLPCLLIPVGTGVVPAAGADTPVHSQKRHSPPVPHGSFFFSLLTVYWLKCLLPVSVTQDSL